MEVHETGEETMNDSQPKYRIIIYPKKLHCIQRVAKDGFSDYESAEKHARRSKHDSYNIQAYWGKDAAKGKNPT